MYLVKKNRHETINLFIYNLITIIGFYNKYFLGNHGKVLFYNFWIPRKAIVYCICKIGSRIIYLALDWIVPDRSEKGMPFTRDLLGCLYWSLINLIYLLSLLSRVYFLLYLLISLILYQFDGFILYKHLYFLFQGVHC